MGCKSRPGGWTVNINFCLKCKKEIEDFRSLCPKCKEEILAQGRKEIADEKKINLDNDSNNGFSF